MANIPFDVLFVIFSFYEETPDSRLETLLLVCRFWNAAALKCKEIWSRLKLDVKDHSTAQFWSHQLPRRLERSGSSSPIYFTLHMNAPLRCARFLLSCTLVKPQACKCYCTTMDSLEHILEAALGPNGSLCARWREINIRFLLEINIGIPFFSYPTPQLTSLTLYHVRYDIDKATILPSAPVLRRINIALCRLPQLPNTSNAIDIRFTNTWNPRIPQDLMTNPRGLADAEKIRYLELNIAGGPPQNYILPTSLPSLRRLYLAGSAIPDNMADVQAPVLHELRIKFDEYCGNTYYFPVQNLVKCNGLPFHQLDLLTIEFGHRYSLRMTDTTWESYDGLIRLCSNVKKLQGRGSSTIFLLRLLKDDCIGAEALANRHFVVFDGEKGRAIRVGKEQRLKDIQTLAKKLGWPQMEENRMLFLRKACRRD